MKSCFLLIPTILATTVAIADTRIDTHTAGDAAGAFGFALIAAPFHLKIPIDLI